MHTYKHRSFGLQLDAASAHSVVHRRCVRNAAGSFPSRRPFTRASARRSPISVLCDRTPRGCTHRPHPCHLTPVQQRPDERLCVNLRSMFVIATSARIKTVLYRGQGAARERARAHRAWLHLTARCDCNPAPYPVTEADCRLQEACRRSGGMGRPAGEASTVSPLGACTGIGEPALVPDESRPTSRGACAACCTQAAESCWQRQFCSCGSSGRWAEWLLAQLARLLFYGGCVSTRGTRGPRITVCPHCGGLRRALRAGQATDTNTIKQRVPARTLP